LFTIQKILLGLEVRNTRSTKKEKVQVRTLSIYLS
jgi:hypothetical protein